MLLFVIEEVHLVLFSLFFSYLFGEIRALRPFVQLSYDSFLEHQRFELLAEVLVSLILNRLEGLHSHLNSLPFTIYICISFDMSSNLLAPTEGEFYVSIDISSSIIS